MNPQPLRPGSQNVQPANKNGRWWLIVAVLGATTLVGLLAGRAGQTPTTSAAIIQAAPRSSARAVINNRLRVPCSVSGCDPTPAVINSHLRVPCSVSGCDPTLAVINSHLRVPCSVSSCGPTPVAPRSSGAK